MAKAKKAVPDGYHTVTPHLILDDAVRAIEFYKRAFGAEEAIVMPGPGSKIAHAEIRIGDSPIMLSDEVEPMPGQPGVYKSPKTAGFVTGAVFLYVENVDAVYERAVKAGCTSRQAPQDMFWGDRYGSVIDPFGHTWAMGTHTEDLTPDEIATRQREFIAKMQGGGS